MDGCRSLDSPVLPDLSRYNWPAQRPPVLDWLEACVHEAVKYLDEAPFLQLVTPSTAAVQHHKVAAAIMQAPQVGWSPPFVHLWSVPCAAHRHGHITYSICAVHCSSLQLAILTVTHLLLQLWQSIAQHVSKRQPEVVVLVHQLPAAAAEEPGACLRTGQWESNSPNVMTGMTAHQALDQECLKRSTAMMEAGLMGPQGVLAGRIGDGCCDDDDHAAISLDISSDPQLVDYWGLVVQSKAKSDAEGCYVLKTMRSADHAGCQCTHYSLTRVCKGGQPLAAQLSSAWLV